MFLFAVTQIADHGFQCAAKQKPITDDRDGTVSEFLGQPHFCLLYNLDTLAVNKDVFIDSVDLGSKLTSCVCVFLTSEFDPLRDEGAAYAEALASAGVDVQYQLCRGHLHTSLHAVGVIISGAPVREQMAQAVRTMVSRSTADV